ncbi:M56 family metallopeptidase [Pedobacter miscanthi]|nr:M56 family metallopeptidase [Pedobacter miscanthi]
MMFYVLSVALILTGCLIFYKLLLQNETFFPLNRYVLLICLVLSFSLPFMPVPEQLSFRKANVKAALIVNEPKAAVVDVPQQKQTVKATNSTENNANNSFFKDISILKLVLWAYWLGVIVFAINFVFQLCVLLYRAYSRPVIIDGRFRIVELAGNQAPCSFANNIFINPEKYDWDTYNQIILHEKIHIQQGHSYDILIAELALVFQWFNPFGWMYRKAIEDNLEFLTDNELLASSNIEPASYQMSLVKVSAPHFPASLTTNYNQSILKKRLVMMNSKKSNVNSTWKYLFILPLFLVFIAFLNEPVAYGKNSTKVKNTGKFNLMENDGTWFATIKGDKVHIRFESDEDGKNNNSSQSFSLAELKNLPKGNEGTFSVTRDAGTMNFTGKFDNNTGMGSYKFSANEDFTSFLAKEGVSNVRAKDNLVFFMVNVKRSYVSGIKAMGYNDISKDNLIPLAALNVTPEYIKSLKAAGLTNADLSELIPLKALDVDADFIKGIKESGFTKLTAEKMITFKSQGITGEYLKNAKAADEESRAANAQTAPVKAKPDKTPRKNEREDTDEDEKLNMLITKKVMNITPDYAKSFADKGLKVTEENLVAMKSLGVTADYYTGFSALGLKVSDGNLIAMKSLGVTPDYYASFKTAGLADLTSEQIISLKSLNVAASDFSEFKKLGFKNLSVDDIISAKATGTSPVFVGSMKKKGHNYNSIEDYIKMKVLAIN